MTEEWICRVVREIAEMDDRDSSADWPEAMLVTAHELTEIISRHAKEIDPWQPMASAPKDGTVVLALLEGSDIPHPVRWVDGLWQSSWDSHRLSCWDGPRSWMAIPPEQNQLPKGED